MLKVDQFRYIIRCSYGNDSVAMLQLMHEHGLKDVAVVYSETDWGSTDWAYRVERGEDWVREIGWKPVRIGTVGFEQLALTRTKQGMWPTRMRKFCTIELKIKPFYAWANKFDPNRRALVCVGVRRAESQARRNHPAFMPEKDDGRHVWHPLIDFSDSDRDALIDRTPLPLVATRSKECEICINANRTDLRQASEPAIERIERMEKQIGRPMFLPAKFMGADGIREVKRWADSERGKFIPASGVVPEYPDIEATLDSEPATCEDNFCGL